MRNLIFIYFILLFSFVFSDIKKEDIILYCGFENSTDIFLPEKNIFINSDFRRESNAYTYDFNFFSKNEPRYVEGKIGKGIFLESGWYGDFKRGTKNLIPLNSSKVENFKEGFILKGRSKFLIYPNKKAIISKNLVKILCEEENSGVEVKEFEAPYVMRYIFSVYLRGESGGEKIKLVVEDETNNITEEKEFTLKKEWDRYFVILPYDEKTKKYKEIELKEPLKIKLKILSCEEGDFYFDALMFEQAGTFYSNRYSPSTWIEGESVRCSEILNIPFEEYTFNLNEGSITFWMKYGDENVNRTFFNIGYGWEKILSLTEYPKNVLNFYISGSNYNERLPEPNVWHFVVITWKESKFNLYIDGIKKCELTPKEQITPEVFKKHLFILPGNSESGYPFSAKTHINGIIDEIYILKKFIEKDDVEKLMREEKRIVEFPEIIFKYEYNFNVLPRKKDGCELKFSIKNTSEEEKQFTATFRLSNIEELTLKENLKLKGYEGRSIIYRIPTQLLSEGEYELNIEINENGKIYFSKFPIKVGLWKDEEKLPIIAWNAGEKDFNEMELIKKLGVNVVPFSINSPKTINWANELGISLFSHMHCIGEGRQNNLEDVILKNDGEYDGINPLSEYVLNSTRNKAIDWVKKIEDYKELKYVIINTEWQLPMDFGEKFKKIVMEKFNIDLRKWETDKTKSWRYINPFNRLTPSILEEKFLPENGVVGKDDNFYNFHFWYHEGNANEIKINKICIEEIKKKRGDINTIIEPILRYPPKKKYGKGLDIAEEWFYYENPKTAIWVQENLNALTRGRDIKISGMPQFLFKAHAQPFSITPPPDLFKESTLLCLSRPLDILTFWGWHNVLLKTKNMYTIEEMEERTKNYDIDSRKWTKEQMDEVKKGGESGLGHVYVPETKDAFLYISENYFLPFGKLFRKWKNYPRKIAVLNSFASWIYSDIRWPSYGYLGEAIISTGIPFDVLWDEDFIENPEILDRYDILFLPKTYAITSYTYEGIKKFIQKGGIVIADEDCKIKGIEKVKVFREDEIDKIKNFIKENVKLPFKVYGDDVLVNFLTLGEGNYLFIVNDKRDFGKYLGKWGKIKEKGIENRIILNIEKNLGDFLYDLNENKLLAGKEKDNIIEYEIVLKGGEGKILYISKEKLEKFEINLVKSEINKGDKQKILISLKGEKNLMKGGIPLKIEIIKPDGRLFDMSGFYLCEDGIFDFSFYLPLNTIEGKWKVKIKEFLTGGEKNVVFSVK